MDRREKIYACERVGGEVNPVWVRLGQVRYVLAPRRDIYDHSPTGFEWGFGGSGPAQLALAILADYLEDDDPLALDLHHPFKERFVARWADDAWAMTGETIDEWITEQES